MITPPLATLSYEAAATSLDHLALLKSSVPHHLFSPLLPPSRAPSSATLAAPVLCLASLPPPRTLASSMALMASGALAPAPLTFGASTAAHLAAPLSLLHHHHLPSMASCFCPTVPFLDLFKAWIHGLLT